LIDAISKRSASFLWKVWYPLLTRLVKNAPVVFLNYGYAPLDGAAAVPALDARDEPDRPCIGLYHRVAGAVPLEGRDVLEISSGHGGGASYVMRYLHPRALRGIDRNPRAIEFAQTHHAVEGLSFAPGDALALAFPNDSFDAVINVEASHCYPDLPRFLGEVERVLRPGGHFLYADFRAKSPGYDMLKKQVEASGLQIVAHEDISLNVVRGMELNNDKYLDLIHRHAPRVLWGVCRRFAGVKGSGMYRELQSGETVYFRYVLRK